MRDAPQTKFTPERKATFLAAYERLGEKKAAAAAAGVTRQTVYDHIATDPDFRAACEAARDSLIGEIVDRLRHCAVEGVKKTTFDKDGNKVSETYVYSDRLMLAWLKRLERDKWGDKVAIDQKVEATVRNTHEITPAQLDRTQRSRVRDLLDTLPGDPSPN